MTWTAAILSLSLLGTAPAAAPELPALPALQGPTMSLTVPHHFPRADAHARLQYLLDYWVKRFHVVTTWSGDRVYVAGLLMGIDFKATIEVTDTSVNCESNDPGFPMRGSARHYVENKLKKYMHPDYLEP